jgi:thiol:disulfide interchange protein DsbD
MRKIFLFLSLILSSSAVFSQIYEPVKWSTSVEKVSETTYDLIVKASIDANWHLYSQNVPEDGPIATSFIFTTSEKYELIGKTSEGEGHTVNDPVFEMKIKYFEKEAIFKSLVVLSSNN